MDPVRPPPPANGNGASPPSAAGVTRTFSFGHLVGALFLVAQVVFIVQTRFDASNPRLLTPLEPLTRYEIHATFDAHVYGATEIRDRYGVPVSGTVCLTPEALQEVIRYREEPIPRERATFVRLHHRRGGEPDYFWLWPQE